METTFNTTTQDLITRLNTYATGDEYQRDIEDAVVALEAAQAEIERQTHIIQGLWMERDVMRAERDAALARLAEIERQEPAYLLTPDGKCYAYGSAQPLSAGHADATLLKLYAAAGASPVEPSQAVFSDAKSLLMPATAAPVVDGKILPVDMSRLPKGAI